MHKSFPHLREIELAKLLESEPPLADSVCDFGHKLVVASGNRNMILTFLEEFLWDILIKLWDSGHLDQSPGAKKLIGVDTGKSVEIALKDKQLKSAQDVIKSLRSEISRLNRQRQIERAASIAQAVSAPTETAPVPFAGDAMEGYHESVSIDTPPNDAEEESDFFVEVGICTDPEPVLEILRCEVTTETDPDPLVNECANSRLMIAKAEAEFHATSTESVSGGYSEERLLLPSETDVLVRESPRVALVRTRTEVVFEQVRPTMPPVDESTGGSSPLVSTDRSRLADLKARELELMKEREIADEMRIEKLLREIVEKDEILKTFNDELDRVRSRSLPLVPTTQLDEVDTHSAHSVSGRIVEEQLLEIHELRKENSRLTNLVLVLEKRFTDSKTINREDFGDVRNATVEVGVATDLINNYIESPNLKTDRPRRPICTLLQLRSIAVVGTGQSVHEKNLEEERDKEAARAARAIEETRKVKIGLGELERQIAALQHQLRQSGVKQEHIESALASSGLSHLVRSNRVGVFERLYQDALERMVKMDKIRERFKDIQQREYERRIKEQQDPEVVPPKSSPTVRIRSQPTAHATRRARIRNLSQSFARRHTSVGDPSQDTPRLVPERYLSAHSVMSECSRK